MKELEGFQKKYLRGLAHGLKPVVLIGQKELSAEVLRSADQALERHELIKVKYHDFKEKEEKAALIERLGRETGSQVVGVIGHTAVFYRQQSDPEKRKISLPER